MKPTCILLLLATSLLTSCHSRKTLATSALRDSLATVLSYRSVRIDSQALDWQIDLHDIEILSPPADSAARPRTLRIARAHLKAAARKTSTATDTATAVQRSVSTSQSVQSSTTHIQPIPHFSPTLLLLAIPLAALILFRRRNS